MMETLTPVLAVVACALTATTALELVIPLTLRIFSRW